MLIGEVTIPIQVNPAHKPTVASRGDLNLPTINAFGENKSSWDNDTIFVVGIVIISVGIGRGLSIRFNVYACAEVKGWGNGIRHNVACAIGVIAQGGD